MYGHGVSENGPKSKSLNLFEMESSETELTQTAVTSCLLQAFPRSNLSLLLSLSSNFVTSEHFFVGVINSASDKAH